MRRRVFSAMLTLTLAAAADPAASRVGWFTTARLGGFIHWSPGGVFGSRWFGENPLPHPWETAATLKRSWGYNRDDEEWKSAGFLLRMAAQNIGLGGNLAINGGGWHLGPATATAEHLSLNPSDKFWLPAHLTGFDQPGAKASWPVAFPAAGSSCLKICQACPEPDLSGELELWLDNQPWAKIPPCGTAPDATEFRTIDLPEVSVASPGAHLISLHAPRPAAKDLRVAWLFLAPNS